MKPNMPAIANWAAKITNHNWQPKEFMSDEAHFWLSAIFQEIEKEAKRLSKENPNNSLSAIFWLDEAYHKIKSDFGL